MKRFLKWAIPVVLLLVIAFAPLPQLRFADFYSVCDIDGKQKDVIIRVNFLHFKPLFFHYGDSDEGYYCFGSAGLYEADSTAHILTLCMKGDSIRALKKNTYVSEIFQYIEDATTSYNYDGYLIWDDSCKNIILTANTDSALSGEDIPKPKDFTYLAAKESATSESMNNLLDEYKNLH